MTDARKSWDSRAATYGNSPQGVLFKNFSEPANAMLHKWHEGIVADRFLPSLPKGGRVLDLGCGYGRIADGISHCRPDLEIIGQDLSGYYCAAFRRSSRHSVQAKIEMLPFAEESFDGIVAVTSLMYVAPSARAAVLSDLAKIMKRGAYAIIFDPGAELQTLIQRVKGVRSGSSTGGIGFAVDEYGVLARSVGLEVCRQGANPAFTAAVLALGGKAHGGWQLRMLSRCVARDLIYGSNAKMVLHRWVVLMKNC